MRRKLLLQYGAVAVVWVVLLAVIAMLFGGGRQTDAAEIAPQQAGRLAYGTTVMGSVNPGSPIAFFSFDGTAGDLVNVQVVGMIPNMNPSIALLSNTQERLAINNNDVFSPITGDASLSAFLPYTGLYLLVVSDAQGQTSDFVLRIDGRADAQAPMLEPNIAVRIDLPAGSAPQFFRFQHQPDCPTTLTIVPETPEFPFAAHVRSVDGASVGILRGGALEENRFTIPPNSGIYEVEVSLADATATGFVGLVITCLADAPFCTSPADLGPLTPLFPTGQSSPTQPPAPTNPPPAATQPPATVPTNPPPVQGPTDTPTPPPQSNCGGFRLSSPLEGLPDGGITVYWDPAPDATEYRVAISNLDNGAAVGNTVPADTLNQGFDVSDEGPLGAGTNFNVYVAALRDGVVICEDGRNMWREAPRPDDPGGGDDPGDEPDEPQLSCLNDVYNGICEPELGETYDACPNECPLKP